MTLATLRAYAPWQLRELVPRAFVSVAMFIVFAGIPVFATMHAQRNNPDFDPNALGKILKMVYVGVTPLCLTLGAFLFMTRSIAEDRERNYVRFIFSHPVSPVPFYLNRFVAGLALFTLCFLPVPLVVRYYFGADVPVLGTVVAKLATLVLIGGLTTLCAALTAKDGLALILVYMGTQLLQQLSAQGILYEWLQPIVRGLPPVESLKLVVKSLIEGTDWPVTDLVHVFGYGIGLLVAGLLVIRRAPLVR
ncbi:MAG: hypothetical protein C0503_08070 [Gemmatimonas sp.]|nr:hypothetical protein [Gemmatimonas sp.]